MKTSIRKLLFLFIFLTNSTFVLAEDAVNMDLSRLVADDQGERRILHRGETFPALDEHDKVRKEKVLTMLSEGKIRAAKDFENASWIMQHGKTLEDFQLAYAFSTIAATMDRDNQSARWLTAATFDRMLRFRGKPQWYGTQYKKIGDNQLELETFDESAVTDDERREKGLSAASDIERKRNWR